jgi:hypothetical protein
MKNITILIFTVVITVTTKAQINSAVFFGLNTQPLSINAGMEFSKQVKKGASFFIRPTYIKKLYNSKFFTFSYIDVPVGIKFLIADNPSSGAGYTIDFNIGSYIGYAISGNYFPTANAPAKKIKFGSGANTQFDAIDYGLFLNTQMTIGGVFGFGISAQTGLAQHDMSKLGRYALTTKQKAGTSLQLTLFFHLHNPNGKHKK